MSTYTATANTFPLKISENINVRPSSLVEIQRIYRIAKNSSPSGFDLNAQVEGAFGGTANIFPGPQISRSNNDMWDTLSITAYGFTSATAREILGTSITELSKTFSQTLNPNTPEAQVYNWTVYESWRTHTATAIKATNKGGLPPGVVPPPQPDFRSRRVIGAVAPGGQQTLTVVWTLADIDISRTNFGMIDEVSLTKGYLPTVS